MKSDHAKDFRERMRALRGDKTLRDYAEKIGMRFAEWHAYERGRKKPSFNKLYELAEKTGKSVTYLLTGSEKK